MLISSSTDIYSGISEVSSGIFTDFSVFFILLAGVIFSFFIITLLLKTFYPEKYQNEIDFIDKK